MKKACKTLTGGIQLLHRQMPGLLLACGLSSISAASAPFVTVFFSARLVEELAGARDLERIQMWVFLTLAATFTVQIAAAALKHWKMREQSLLDIRCRRLINYDKVLNMDFAVLDEPEILAELSEIEQNDIWSGIGIRKIPYVFESICQGVTGIAVPLILTVSLFSSKSGNPLLDSPFLGAALIAAMLLLSLGASSLKSQAQKLWIGGMEEAKFSNRMFTVFGNKMSSREFGLDARIYEQESLNAYMDQNHTFAPGGIFSRIFHGIGGVYVFSATALPVIFLGLCYAYVCAKAWSGAFGVGMVTQYVAAVTAMQSSFEKLTITAGEWRTLAPYVGKVLDFLAIPNIMYQGSLTTEKRADCNYEIEFRHVTFRYPNTEFDALHDINIKFEIGRRLAVVGENGSGKTTFIKLLCRLYDPTEGEILLNGIDIRKYKYDEYMAIFSVVFQDFKLLARPLGENVATDVHYEQKKVEKCLHDAGFVMDAKWKKGLDTPLYKDLEKEGIEVSGGEAQKIAIARSLYRDAPFIILDEPTAALDPVAEAEIYTKFDDIIGDKTGIYISHRLSSCRFCDNILVFDAGSVVQKGTHEQLVADEQGRYYGLWSAQAQYYT